MPTTTKTKPASTKRKGSRVVKTAASSKTRTAPRKGDARLRPVMLDDGNLAWVEPPKRRPLRTLASSLRVLAFRYRAQAGPVALIAGVWALGAVAAPFPALTVGVLGALVLAGTAGASVKLGLGPGLRAYLLASVAAACGWIAAAAAFGAGGVAAAVLWPTGCAFAAPWWWRHRLRGAPAPTDGTEVELWSQRVACPGGPLPESTLTDVTPVRGGWRAVINLVPGRQTTDDAVAATRKVTSAFRLTTGSLIIEPTSEGMEHQAGILVLERNPLQRVQPWPGPGCLDNSTGIAALGVHADGATAPYRFWRNGSGPVHDLIAGTTDAGKSGLLDQLLALERHSGLMASLVIDPQRGQSVVDWTEAVHWFAGDMDETLTMLRAVRDEMYARNEYLSRVEWADAKGRTRRGKKHFDPTPEMPIISVTIDEAERVLQNESAQPLVAEMAQMTRKTGIRFRFVVHVPLLPALGNSQDIKDAVAAGNVIVLRTANRLTGQVAFQGTLPVEPHKLPRNFPDGSSTAGLGFILGPADRPATMRAYYVDDPYDYATTGEPVQLRWLSAAAAEAHAGRFGRASAAGAGDTSGPVAADASVGPDAMRWNPASQVAEVDDPTGFSTERGGDTARDVILAALADADGNAKTGELLAATNRAGYAPRTGHDAIKALETAGRVAKTAHGRYRLADRQPHAVGGRQ